MADHRDGPLPATRATQGAHADIAADIRTARDLAEALGCVVRRFGADSGTLHFLEDDGLLHLKALSGGFPPPVLAAIRTIPVGKGMAGLAVARAQPVDACNIQTDTSGDVRPGARATGMEGAIVVPVLDGARAVGALGIASRTQRMFDADERSALLAAGRAFLARPDR